MKVCGLPCVAGVLVVFLAAVSALDPPERPYKILMLLPTSSKSHRNVFMPLATALTARGHKITMLGNHPLHDNNPNIKYIFHGMKHFDEGSMDMFQIAREPERMFEMFEEIFPKIARDLYTVPEVKQLYDSRKQFDVILIDQIFNEAAFPFLHEMPFISVSTGKLDSAHSAMMGNIQNPAYVSNLLDDYPFPYSFVDRVKNIFFSIAVPNKFRQSILNPTQIEISKQFPELPSLQEIRLNESLNLINSHFTMTQSLPLLPNQVLVGGMHLRPAKPLPKDIEKFVSGPTPVIYFSLGSVARSTNMDPEHKKILLDVFAKLPYKVIWKYEEDFPNLPKNILVQKWMPQQDILGHPNVKIFISHCGLLGIQEAMYNGKPILGMPIFGDQPKNAKQLAFKGLGRYVHWNELSEKSLIDNLKQLIENPRYRQNMERVARTFRDQLDSPTDRAVFWTEYVIRHNGARHLRSNEADLSWIQVLHIDILVMVHVMLYLVYKMISKVLGLCFGSKNKKASKKNKLE